jgi:DnaJ-class molecular chaperone
MINSPKIWGIEGVELDYALSGKKIFHMHDELEEYYLEQFEEKAPRKNRVSLDCPFCTGTGVHPGTMNQLDYSRCPVCEGTGLMKFKGDLTQCTPCVHCGASGREPDSSPLEPCSVCGGHGVR